MDPIEVLAEPSRLKRAVRVAAFRAVQTERQRAEDEAAAKRSRRPRLRR